MNTRVRINRMVREAIPKGKSARIVWYPTGFSSSQVLRVVTPAWKTLPRYKRVSKLRETLDRSLTPKERAKIFRISVLTAAELRRLIRALPAGDPDATSPVGFNGRHSMTAAS